MNARFCVSAVVALTGTAGLAMGQCSASQSACEDTAVETSNIQSVSYVVDHHNEKDIIDTAVAAGSFKTLAAALNAAGLIDTLKGDGPYTVFAPTDEAFAKLPKGTVETLLKPENKAKLQAILLNHVVKGDVMASRVVKMSGATAVGGQRLEIRTTGNGVTVDGVKVIKTDVTASNGVIHVIDSVMLPADKTIVETASAAGSFSTLLAAAKAAGLAELLGSEGPFTVLAPTDEAFEKLGSDTIAMLLKPENKGKLAEVLKFHVIPGRIFADGAIKAGTAATAQGGEVVFSIREGAMVVNGVSIIATDIDASNGVIHVIDTVLLPE